MLQDVGCILNIQNSILPVPQGSPLSRSCDITFKIAESPVPQLQRSSVQKKSLVHGHNTCQWLSAIGMPSLSGTRAATCRVVRALLSEPGRSDPLWMLFGLMVRRSPWTHIFSVSTVTKSSWPRHRGAKNVSLKHILANPFQSRSVNHVEVLCGERPETSERLLFLQGLCYLLPQSVCLCRTFLGTSTMTSLWYIHAWKTVPYISAVGPRKNGTLWVWCDGNDIFVVRMSCIVYNNGGCSD